MASVTMLTCCPVRSSRPKLVLGSTHWGGTPIEAHVSLDGLVMYFSEQNRGRYGQHDLFQATRTSTDHVFDPHSVTNLGPGVNTSSRDFGSMVSDDGLRIYFYRDWNRIYMASRTSTDEQFGDATVLSTLDSSAKDLKRLFHQTNLPSTFPLIVPAGSAEPTSIRQRGPRRASLSETSGTLASQSTVRFTRSALPFPPTG